MQKSVAAIEKRPERINVFRSALRMMSLATACMMAIAFLLSRSILVESIAPLGLAFFICTVKYDRYRIPVFASALLGTMLSGNSGLYVAKYCVCLVVILAFSRPIKKCEKVLWYSLLGAGSVLAISVGQALFSNKMTYDLMMAGAEGIVTFVSIYIFSYGTDLLANVKNRMSVRPEEAISVTLLVTFTIMGIGEISILGVSFRTVLSTVVILMTAIIGGSTMGASTGVVVGIAFLINDVTTAVYMGIYAFAGLISGVFNKINKYICILGYILSWVIIYTYTTGISSNMMQIRDILIASMIVILMPNKVFSKIEKLITSNISSNEKVNDYIERSRDLTKNRLDSIHKTYADLAKTFDRIRERDKILDQRDIATVVDMIYNDECKTCSMRRRCWDSKFNYTYTRIFDIIATVEELGDITVEDVNTTFRKECMKPEAVVKMATYYYRMFALDYEWSNKFSESRKLIANQIRSISKSIESLSKDLENNIMLDLEKEKNIYDNLQRHGVDVDKVSYITKAGNEFEIAIDKRICANGKLCDKKITSALSEIIGEELTARKIGCNGMGDRCKCVFTKAQNYKAITEVASMSREGDVFCGDNYTFMEIDDGKYMMAISDGMGKDKKAYEESSATIDILEKMMDAKIEDDIIIDTINNMLMLKSSDEMFSTLDLGIIDLRRGALDTIKMGACSTYIKRSKGDTDLLSSSSLPVGILSDINIERRNADVGDGDFVIMVSDGIIDAGIDNDLGDNWLIYYLDTIATTNPSSIARSILDKSLELQPDGIKDDMTVLVTKICAK
ncbi:MAG: stage II sporulation protein E [Clostridioides sp.]|jgi:stage II sporulation protein E|nr:stage II sporulation protein E [Clostridioides sp.]